MKKVLLVDNHFATLEVMESLLELYNFAPIIISDYDNIESVINEDCPDMIILETELAGRDGKIICRQIKAIESYKSINIILCSSHGAQLINYKTYNADGILKKPFSLNDLNAILLAFNKPAHDLS